MTKKRVLIADDDKLVHLMYADALSPKYEVLHAYDGEEAMRTALEEDLDLIVLDGIMPSIDGLAVCRTLKGDSKTRHIKILMLSARDDQVDRLVGLEVGADDYLEKPLSPDQLKGFVAKLLRKP